MVDLVFESVYNSYVLIAEGPEPPPDGDNISLRGSVGVIWECARSDEVGDESPGSIMFYYCVVVEVS